MEEIYRLAKPRRKGILRIVFSRFFLFLLLMILEVMIYVSFYLLINSLLPYFSAFMALFTVAGVIYIFNNDMDSSAKLTWMFLIALLPIPGAIFLFFTQMNFGERATKKRVNEIIEKTKTAIPQPEGVLELIEKDGSGTDDLSRYLCRGGCFNVYNDTEVKYYPLGENMLEDLLEDLKKAEKFIFMEYFIIEEGYMWGKILEILVEKAKAGVDVRVMYDGMCLITLLPFNYNKLLEAKGIKAKSFAPIRPVVSSHYNYRDHRKITVIDGKIAFNGGVNLADEYINHIEVFGHWKDTAVRLKGDAVKSFTLLFLQMWNITEKEPEYDKWITAEYEPPARASGFVLPFGDIPLDKDKAGENVYMDILNRATDYVHIMTPYLILDDEFESSLLFAAERGIDVTMILPGIPDKKPIYALAKSHYKRLVEAGIKIYEYTPGFVHAKVFVSDDKKAVVGTINMDYRSLYHHYECATYMYQTECVNDIEADFQETLAKCREVTLETIKHEKIGYKFGGALIKFIAPLV